METFVARQREMIPARIGGVNFNIEYLNFFGSQHDPHRARLTTEALWRKLTHGQTISAQYSNPLGVKKVPNLEVGATWAIGNGLELLQGSIHISGESVDRSRPSGKKGKGKPTIERNASLVITPIRKDGKRLVTEKGVDGNTHRLFIHWTPEDNAQKWIKAEQTYIQRKSR